MFPKFCLLLSGALLGVACVANAQSASVTVCGVAPVVAANSRPNIFSPQQELWLGEALRDYEERYYSGVNDSDVSYHLQAIVDRLAKNVPEPHVPFRVVMIESSEVNAFSIAGGFIYVNRKLAATVKSDDELAAVLGHEMGHIASHQQAFEVTEELQRLLHVTSVTDKADIETKFQQLMDAAMKDKHPPKDKEDANQDEADHIGIYLAAAAGYKASTFIEFFDRSFAVDGKTGNKWTDFAGTTTSSQKRLRGIKALVAQLPQGCGLTISSDSEAKEFAAWQKRVIENQKSHEVDEKVVATPPVKLNPPLQMEVTRLRFSPDGNYLLAQDESSVYVLTRNPFDIVFRFDAYDAQYAWFTPDSKAVTFTTPGLHTEEWSIADKKLLEAHEPLAKHDCIQPRLSPDGRTTICQSFDQENWMMGLSLIDTTSGDVVWQKDKFYSPTWRDLIDFETYRILGIADESMYMSYSSDGNFLLIGPSNSKVAIDLRTRTPVKLASDLLNVVTGDYAFLGNDRVAGVHAGDSRASGVFSFPSGKRLPSVPYDLGDMKSVADPGDKAFVLSESIHGVLADKDAKPDKKEGYKNALKIQDRIAVVDVSVPKYLWGAHGTALDIWTDWTAEENLDGSISLGFITGNTAKEIKRVTLPPSPLGRLRAAALSPDGRFLAYSTRDRSGVWDVHTGVRLALLHPFSDVTWPTSDSMVAEFQKSDKNDQQIVMFDLGKHESRVLPLKVDHSEKESSGMDYKFYEDWKVGKGKARELSVLRFDGTVSFTKSFPDGYPRWTTSYGARDFLFSYPIKSSTGKSLIAADATLQAQAADVKKKEDGRVIEVIDAINGSVVGRTVLEVPFDYAGTAGLNRVGNNLYVTGFDNRTFVYSISTGKKIWQTFGTVTDVDTATERVMVTNRRDEEIVLDGAGNELLHTHLGYPVRFARFQEHGTKIMMLTSDQSVRTVDIPKAIATSPAP